MEKYDIKTVVRDKYAQIARQEKKGCCPSSSSSPSSCCGSSPVKEISKNLGYSQKDTDTVPEGANLGLGCGNPIALAKLKEGEVVLDLGSGGGLDCFLASAKVGEKGKVIGVDMTPEMVERARENARKGDYKNVEFRLGEIENIPCGDGLVDVIISNCVINLSPDKKRVFQEAHRVLKPGGRLMVSDIVLGAELPEDIKNSVLAYVGCLAGAVLKKEYINLMESAGFQEINIIGETPFPMDCITADPIFKDLTYESHLGTEQIQNIGKDILSIKISATKK